LSGRPRDEHARGAKDWSQEESDNKQRPETASADKYGCRQGAHDVANCEAGHHLPNESFIEMQIGEIDVEQEKEQAESEVHTKRCSEKAPIARAESPDECAQW